MARALPLHAAGPVFGVPCSAGRLRPSGSSDDDGDGSAKVTTNSALLVFPFLSSSLFFYFLVSPLLSSSLFTVLFGGTSDANCKSASRRQGW